MYYNTQFTLIITDFDHNRLLNLISLSSKDFGKFLYTYITFIVKLLRGDILKSRAHKPYYRLSMIL